MITPCCFDHDPSQVRVARLRDPSAVETTSIPRESLSDLKERSAARGKRKSKMS